MKNIEKYRDEIEAEIRESSTLDCAICSLRGDVCDENYLCTNCHLKSLDWLLQEYKEPILTNKEKAYLKKKIKPKRDSVIHIRKIALLKGTENEFTNIVIATKDTLEAVATSGMPFEGMKLEREYSLEELGL